MATDISVYTDPGVYQSEVINPTSLALSSLANLLAIVGTAPRVRLASNETVRRGQVSDETLTFTLASPHRATLTNKGNRRKQDTQLYRGTDLLPDAAYSYVPATVTGVAGPFVIAANTFITLNLDGLGWISIPLTAGGAQTAAQVAADINAALAADARYGVAYNAVANGVTGSVVITSPQMGALSDLRFIATPVDTPPGAAIDGTVAIFGIGLPFIASVVIELLDAYYSGTATYTVNYIAVDTLVDPLANTGVQSITRIGLYANVTSFASPADYSLSGDNVDWIVNVQVSVTSLTGPFDTTTANNLYLAVNGLSALAVALPVGLAITPAQVATAINQALIASSAYGPLYGSVATVVGATVVLTAPNPFKDHPVAQGVNSTIEFFDTPANALTIVFGIATSATPYQTTGSANQPVVGATYFVTYRYTRPTTDYNSADVTTHLFSTSQDAIAYTSDLESATLSLNQLGMAAEIAFENDAPRVLLIQVNDSTMPGLPTINQFKAAIDAAKDNDAITDIIALDTRLSVQTYLIDHVTTQSSLLEKAYRTGWYGMARNTAVGDRDTPDTFVYRAMVTLQVPPDSPGRGRMILTAPPNIAKTFTMSDGTEQKVSLNSTYLAVAVAARKTSFLSVATSLLRKTVVGFDLDDFQVYTKAERRTLAANGTNVVTLVGGRLVLTDPVTTEQGAGGLIEFVEPSAIAQKDRVSRVVDQVIDANLVGIVPSDIADFINDVKGYIALALRSLIESGDIARYKNSDGTARDIDLSRDMQVFQSPTDPRTFRFRYFYNLRYPAKRFFGEYSVDNPFFSPE